MKKLFLLLFGIGILQANAQKLQSIYQNTQLFVKLGATQNNLFNHPLFNQQLIGLEMGAHLQTKWSEKFYTHVGLSYVRKGSAREVIYNNFVGEKVLSYTENVYLHYVQLPLIFNYKHTFSGYLSKKYKTNTGGYKEYAFQAVSPYGSSIFSLYSPHCMFGLPPDKKGLGIKVKNNIKLTYYYFKDTLATGEGDTKSQILYDEFIGDKIK